MFMSPTKPRRSRGRRSTVVAAGASRPAPVYARFLQADPLGYEDGMNMYGYVGGDPVNFTDPLGLQTCQNVKVGGGKFLDSEGYPVVFVIMKTLCWDDRKPVGPDPGRGGPSRGEPGPQKPEPQPPLEKAKQCASSQLGLGDLAAAGAAVSGLNILKTRGKFAGATPGTSIASRGASAVFGNARLPVQLPTVVGNPLTLNMSIRATSSVARVVGRAIPVVGWGLLLYDAAKIVECVTTDD